MNAPLSAPSEHAAAGGADDAAPIAAARPAARRSRQARVAWGENVVTIGGDAPVLVGPVDPGAHLDEGGLGLLGRRSMSEVRVHPFQWLGLCERWT